jgi:hypothetical protein
VGGRVPRRRSIPLIEETKGIRNLLFLYTELVAAKPQRVYCPLASRSSKWFQENDNAKFTSIYGPVFGISFVGLLCHKHRWPDRYE